MALNSKGANLLVKNLAKAGVKITGKAASAAAKLAPLVGVLALYSDLEKIPGIGHVLKFTRNAQQWVYDKTLGQVPVLGWFTNWTSEQLENMFDVSHPDTRDEWENPIKKKVPKTEPETEENDATWYGDIKLPVNIERPMGFTYYNDLVSYPTLGMVPKLNMVVVDLPVFYNSPQFKTNVSYLLEAMRANLRSNLTYNMNQIRAFILNNISIYIIAKLLERKLGFMKYADEQFPEFHELWQYSFKTTDSYGVYTLVKSEEFNVAGDRYASNLDTYEALLDTIFQCILPVHMKAWIDHYFGSIFILDDDTKNTKYSFLLPQTIPFYGLDASGEVEVKSTITTEQINPEYLYQLCDSFFNNSLHTVIKSDIMKQDNLTTKVQVADFAVGWLTSMNNYNPTPIKSETYKQMLINGYTSDNMIGKDGAIRIDSTTGGVSDILTTILALGAMVPGDNTFKVKGMRIVSSSCIFYADSNNPVYLPGGFFQQASTALYNDIGCYTPTQMVYTSDVSGDIYCNVNVKTSSTSNKPVYYPSNEYPTSVPNTSAYSVSFTADESILSDNANNLRWFMNGKYGVRWDDQNLCVLIPIIVTQSRYLIALRSKAYINSGLGVSAVIRNTSDLTTYFDLVLIDKTATYSGVNVAYVGQTNGNILNTIAEKMNGCYIVPSDMGTSTAATISINNSNAEILFEISASASNWNFYYAAGTPLKFTVAETFTAQTLLWIVGEDIAYPSASLTEEVFTTTGTISKTELAVISGFINYSSYLFTAMGYSIPVQPILTIHKAGLDGDPADTVEYARTMLKEDYIPYIIRQKDVPALWNKMFNTLLSFNVKK